ncbi:MAG: hypothetical protein JSS34_06325 [Proteobacteria bacterium]|nr:hypothetical protein [Pseudomonadota bacterium]
MDETSILKVFFEKVGEVGFYNVSYENLAQELLLDGASLKSQFPEPIDFLKALLKSLDKITLAPEDLSLTLKEALFECCMVRIEALDPYKNGLKHLIKEIEKTFFYEGRNLLFLKDITPFLLKSMESILKEVGIEPHFPKKWALLIVFSLTLRVWIDEETGDLSQTLQALDHSLNLLFLKYENF